MALDGYYNISGFVSPKGPLEEKYTVILQGILQSNSISQLNEKLVSALFLDKISKTSGAAHPDTRLVEQHGFSCSTAASMQFIRYLSDIRHDSRVPPEARAAIDTWIQAESDYLAIPIIFDGWRSKNQRSVGVAFGMGFRIQNSEQMRGLSIVPPEEEVNQVAQSFANRIRQMLPGQKFKMLSGYNIHETRLIFEKRSNGTFTMYHYNTAGSLNIKENISAGYLEEQEFWKRLILAKMDAVDITKTDNELGKLGTTPERTPNNISKTTQMTDSCPVKAVDADFKCHMVRSASDEEQGLIHYKLIKSMMAQYALVIEKEMIDPRLYTILEGKEQIKRRYLTWLTLSQDPEQYRRVKEIYLELISMLKPDHRVDMEKKIEKLPPIMALSVLDKHLDLWLDHVSPHKANEILRRQEQLSEGCPLFCLKYLHRRKKVQESVAKVREMALSRMGRSMEYLRTVLRERLPYRIFNLLDRYLDVYGMKDYEFRNLLSDFFRHEHPETSLVVFEELMNFRMMNVMDLEQLFATQLRVENKPVAKALAKCLLERWHPRDGAAKRFSYLAAMDSDQVVTAIQCFTRGEPMDNFALRDSLTALILHGRVIEVDMLIRALGRDLNNVLDNCFSFFIGSYFFRDGIIEYFLRHLDPAFPDSLSAVRKMFGWHQLKITPERLLCDRLIERFGSENTAALLKQAKAPLHFETIKYLTLERKILPWDAVAQLLKVQDGDQTLWIQQMGVLVAQGMPITYEMIDTMVTRVGYDKKRRLEIAEMLSHHQQRVPPQLEWYCLLLRDPEQFLQQLAEGKVTIDVSAHAKRIVAQLSDRHYFRFVLEEFPQPLGRRLLKVYFDNPECNIKTETIEEWKTFVLRQDVDAMAKLTVTSFIANRERLRFLVGHICSTFSKPLWLETNDWKNANDWINGNMQ